MGAYEACMPHKPPIFMLMAVICVGVNAKTQILNLYLCAKYLTRLRPLP